MVFKIYSKFKTWTKKFDYLKSINNCVQWQLVGHKNLFYYQSQIEFQFEINMFNTCAKGLRTLYFN